MKRALVLACLQLTAACGPGDTTSSAAAPTPATSTGPPPAPSNVPVPIAGTPIVAGELVRGGVEGSDPVCFMEWDASGHCRQFDLTASADGTLLGTLRWPAPSRGVYDPDIFLVGPDGTWEFAEDAFPEKHVSLPSKADSKYRVVILAYGSDAQPFDLRVELQR